MSFMQRSAREFVLIRAAREIRREIEKAGLDNLKILAGNGISIVGTYLNGCSPQEKEKYRRELNVLLQMGISGDILLEEVSKQMLEIGPIMKGKEGYMKAELQKITEFLKGS